MDKKRAITVLTKVVRCYLDMYREDFTREENQEEYVEILQALKVLNG